MWPSLRKTTRGRILESAVSALFLLMTAAMVKTFAGADKDGEWATYSHGVLRVVIPYRAAQAGAGRLTVAVLDPENHILGQTEEPAEVAKGASQFRAELKLEKPVPLEELVWHRVRYEFRYDDAKGERWRAWIPSRRFCDCRCFVFWASKPIWLAARRLCA